MNGRKEKGRKESRGWVEGNEGRKERKQRRIYSSLGTWDLPRRFVDLEMWYA